MPGTRVLYFRRGVSAPGANTSFATVTVPPGVTTLRYMISLAAAAIVSVVIDDGTSTSTTKVNGGVAVPITAGFEFDVLVASATTDSTSRTTVTAALQVSVDGVIDLLSIQGLVDPVA
jgi:hypothetical protein